GPEDEPEASGRRRLGRGLAGDLRRTPVELDRLVGEAVLGEHEGRAAERVRLDHVGPRREVAEVHPADDVAAPDHQVLVAALEVGPSEVGGGQVLGLHPGAGGPVEHEDLLGEELLERLGPFALRRTVRASGHGTRNYAWTGPALNAALISSPRE